MTNLLEKWSHQTVVICHSCSSWDAYGNPVLGTSSDNIGIVQRVNRIVIGRDGKEKVANTQILFRSSCPIGYADKLTLPTGEQPAILSIEVTVDFNGDVEYYRVFT